ncbi:MAG: zinc-finger domain-containing protein [Pseudomonadota bacterium]
MKQNSEQIVFVDSTVKTVCCRGGEGALGHPAVYLYIEDRTSVKCYYCGKQFIKQE